LAFTNFITWYMKCLSTFPLLTKSLTSGFLGFIGDSAAQFFEERIRAKHNIVQPYFVIKYDKKRAMSVVADSIFFTGPLLHFAYGFLENLVPTSGSVLQFPWRL
jgi:hypothetical protein